MEQNARSLARLLALFSLVRGALLVSFDQPQVGLAVYAFTRYVPTAFWGIWAVLTGVALLCCSYWNAPSRLWKTVLWANIGHWLALSTLLVLSDPRQIAGALSAVVVYCGLMVIYEQARAQSARQTLASPRDLRAEVEADLHSDI